MVEIVNIRVILHGSFRKSGPRELDPQFVETAILPPQGLAVSALSKLYLEDLQVVYKAPCSFMVDTWALKGLPYPNYPNFGVYVYATELPGARFVLLPLIYDPIHGPLPGGRTQTCAMQPGIVLLVLGTQRLQCSSFLVMAYFLRDYLLPKKGLLLSLWGTYLLFGCLDS